MFFEYKYTRKERDIESNTMDKRSETESSSPKKDKIIVRRS